MPVTSRTQRLRAGLGYILKLGAKLIGWCLLILFIIIIIPLVGVVKECQVFTEITPIEETVPPETQKIRDRLDDYTRLEDQTYLTLPEWYIVYSADEYAAFLEKNPPSQFPYFQAIGQFWQSYYNVCAITRDKYALNSGYHLTLVVIGTSFTLENTIKGVYENTVGRLTEWFSSSELTPEDEYAYQVAKAYGEFIHTIPWYEFDYQEKLDGLWQITNSEEGNGIRKWERKLALGLEYKLKSIYAGLIRQGTQSAYSPELLEIQLWAEGVSDELLQEETQVRVIMPINEQTAIAAVPRYEAFTMIMPKLVEQGVQFIEIAGNDEILISIIAPHDWEYNLEVGEFLFDMEILTQPTLKRMAINVPIKSLHTVLLALENNNIKLEHIYDY